MNPKKLFALALAMMLLLIGTGVLAQAQSAEGTPAPVETAGAEETPAAEAAPEAQATSNVVMPGESIAPAEQTAEPTVEEAAETASPYARVPDGTRLYRDRARTDELGRLDGDAVMLVRSERDGLYETFFETDRTLKGDDCEHAYFAASSVEFLSGEKAAACPNASALRRVDGKPVLKAEVEYAEPAPAQAEAPAATNPDHPFVNASDVNLRGEPSRDAQRVARLQKGESVEVVGSVIGDDGETWYAVTYQGHSGYIRADLVDNAGDVPQLRGSTQTEEPERNEPPIEQPAETEIPGEAEVATEAEQPAEPEVTAEPTAETEVLAESEVTAEAKATVEPAAETEQPAETEIPVEPEMPALYLVTCFDENGETLAVCEVESGKAIPAEALAQPEGDFLGWYACDEHGEFLAEAPYDLTLPVEGPVYLRARMAEQPAPRLVTVSAAHEGETLRLGDTITLTATLTGYEGLNYTCRWQYAAADRDGNVVGEWQDAQADALSFTYELTEDNLLTAWRMCVTVDE